METEKVGWADGEALMFPMGIMGSHESLYFDLTRFVYALNGGMHAMVYKGSQGTIFKNWYSPSTMSSQGWDSRHQAW